MLTEIALPVAGPQQAPVWRGLQGTHVVLRRFSILSEGHRASQETVQEHGTLVRVQDLRPALVKEG